MSDTEVELSWGELQKLTAELIAENGPGSEGWNAEQSNVKPVNDAFMKALRENNGKVPGELEDVPMLIITTTGAKTGKPREVPLAYVVVDDRLVIIASMGGAPKHPPWYHNLVKDPNVLVEKDGESFQARAEITQGDDRNHVFAEVCAAAPVFADYQARTSREIPVIELKRL